MISNKIVCAFAMVKNEEDIIESFIRHNMKYVDKLFISDNNSTDGTNDILKKLIDEGYDITIWLDKRLDYIQSEITTNAYNKISLSTEFDLFFPLDADEFIILEDTSFLDKMEIGDIGILERNDYVLKSPYPSVDIVSSMTNKMVEKNWEKVFIYHNEKNFKNIIINQGNHSVSYNGSNKNLNLKPSGIRLAHYPYRGIGHYLSKILLGSQAMIILDKNYLADSKKTMANHWKKEYCFFKEKKGVIEFKDYIQRIYNVDDVSDLDKLTILDNSICSVNIKYDHLRRQSLIYSLVINYETLAKKFWVSYKYKSFLLKVLRKINRYL